MKNYPQRTSPQNKSLHKFCELVAEEMSNAGYTMEVFARFPFKLNPTPTAIKDAFRTIATAQTQKNSTAKLTTKEMQDAYEEFNKWLGEDLHIHVPWPSIINQIQDDNNN